MKPATTPFPHDALGITSTIPIEIPLAAGRRVLDLNNRFIGADSPLRFVKRAENEGFPRTCCSWIRGLFGLIRETGVRRVIFVTGGDCSNTHAMLETLLPDLEEIHTFSFPYPPDPIALRHELGRFCGAFGISLAAAEQTGLLLAPIRRDLAELDRLTWQENLVMGGENHLFLVSSSDFDGNPEEFHNRLRKLLAEARGRTPRLSGPRLGIIGVPPINTDLHDLLESLGARIVFNEIPRQFAMTGPETDLTARYTAFTYPYGVWPRIADIQREILRRSLDGLVHYTQAFCHRQIHDIMLRREIRVPVLTIEGENPGPTDQRTRLRLESFLEILTRTSGEKRKGPA
ncbi:MAG: 2-hydroxyacyl-CoA dehydratase [Candidatus Ozemobacteraceae bacterium]